MVNLDAKGLRYMSTDEMRVLTAVEMGMKNHEYVPSSLIEVLSGLKRGGAFKLLRLLAKHKLVQHESVPQESFRLTNKGYDWLALRALGKRGSVDALGIRIGMGKESDIYTCMTSDAGLGEICIKIHRLGRNCFRTVKNNRDYLKANQSASWLYLSRLSALKEYAFMKALYDKGFPTPTPIDVNRHCVLMSLSHAYQLNSIAVLRHPSRVFGVLMALVCRLAGVGLIHCDFNEFNLLVDDDENVTMIDFPQMVSTSHINAQYYFDRDVDCVRTFFKRRFGFVAESVPTLAQALAETEEGAGLDDALRASGWNAAQEKVLGTLRELDESLEGVKGGEGGEEEEEEGEEEEESEEEEGEAGEEAGEAGDARLADGSGEVEAAAPPDRAALRDLLPEDAEVEAEAEVVGEMAHSLADVSLDAVGTAGTEDELRPAASHSPAASRPAPASGLGQVSTRRREKSTAEPATTGSAPAVAPKKKKAAAPPKATATATEIADRVKQERGRGAKVKYGGRNEMKNRESRKTMSQLKSEGKDMGIY